MTTSIRLPHPSASPGEGDRRGTSREWYQWFREVDRSVKSLDNWPINVKNAPYNAKGDGVHDDTAAIQAAKAAAKATGRSLWFPHGTYLLDAATFGDVGSGFRIAGAGKYSTILKSRAGDHVIEITGSGVSNNIVIEDLQVLGNGGAGHGIYVHDVSNADGPPFLQLRRVAVANTGGKGIYAPRAWQTSLEDVEVTGSADNNFELGTVITSRFVGCYARNVSAGKTGYRILSGNPTMIGCNGVDVVGAGASWGVFGCNPAEDGQTQYARPTLIGCNVESFPDIGIRCKAGSFVNLIGTTLRATVPNSRALVFDYVNQYGGYLDASTTFVLGPGASWLNNQPIHHASSTSPFGLVQGQGAPRYFRDTNAGRDQTLPTVYPTYVGFVTNMMEFVPGLRAKRSDTATAAMAEAAYLLHETSGTVANNFGVELAFQIAGAGLAPTTIGYIGVLRRGADDTGDIVFRPANAGVFGYPVRIRSDGVLALMSNGGGAAGLAIWDETGQTKDNTCVVNHVADTVFAQMVFGRARNTLAAPGAVLADDQLGRFEFRGFDGSNYIRGAYIRCDVDGTPGTGVMPGRLVVFVSPPGSGTPTEALRVSSDKTTRIIDGTWNGGHLLLGPHHLWVDSSGRLRINSSAPTGDTDGTIVGTQS